MTLCTLLVSLIIPHLSHIVYYRSSDIVTNVKVVTITTAWRSVVRLARLVTISRPLQQCNASLATNRPEAGTPDTCQVITSLHSVNNNL